MRISWNGVGLSEDNTAGGRSCYRESIADALSNNCRDGLGLVACFALSRGKQIRMINSGSLFYLVPVLLSAQCYSAGKMSVNAFSCSLLFRCRLRASGGIFSSSYEQGN